MLPTFTAFISDLDDTLLDENHHLPARTEQTLRRLLAQGVKVVLASGRAGTSMRPVVRQIETPYPYIAFNGAQIISAADDSVLFADEVATPLARDVLKWFEDRGVYIQYYHDDDWFFQKRNELSDAYEQSTGVPGTETGIRLSEHIQAPAPKLLAMDTPENVQRWIQEAGAHFADTLSITTSKPFFVEITSPTATKGNAVRKLAEHLSLRPDTTLVAGDSLNDLSMLTWSKYPITVSNAREEIRQMAWRTAAKTAGECGMAYLLDEIIPEVKHNAH